MLSHYSALARDRESEHRCGRPELFAQAPAFPFFGRSSSATPSANLTKVRKRFDLGEAIVGTWKACVKRTCCPSWWTSAQHHRTRRRCSRPDVLRVSYSVQRWLRGPRSWRKFAQRVCCKHVCACVTAECD